LGFTSVLLGGYANWEQAWVYLTIFQITSSGLYEVIYTLVDAKLE
jgi:hypothetical protein